jgi:hypothetical protein
MGLALGIVLECDLIVAAAGTKFQVTETSRGLGGAYPSLAPLFKPITEFVPDSPLEGAVTSEPVSEPKFPVRWENTGYSLIFGSISPNLSSKSQS